MTNQLEVTLREMLLRAFAADPAALSLPLLSDGARAVLRATSAEEPDLLAVAEGIGRDSAMAAHVLRMANSALHRGSSVVHSISLATMRLGARRIREVALLAASETRNFPASGFQDALTAERRIAVARALFAAEIARVRRLNVEEAFVAGLLADIGVPVLLQQALALLHGAATLESDAAARDAIWQLALPHHARVGAHVCRAWGLSPLLADVVAHHHAAEPPEHVACMVWTLNLAEILAYRPDIDLDELAGMDAVASLNLYAADLMGVAAKSATIMETVRELS